MSFQQRLNNLSPNKLKFKILNDIEGKENDYVETQRKAEEHLANMSNLYIVKAHEHGPSCLDGFLSNGSEFKCGYEIKTRNTTFSQMQEWGSFMISKSKIDTCAQVCGHLVIPFIVVFYSIPEDFIKVWFITDDNGFLQDRFEMTQKTIKGRVVTFYLLPW